jgi:hypothetical protein
MLNIYCNFDFPPLDSVFNFSIKDVKRREPILEMITSLYLIRIYMQLFNRNPLKSSSLENSNRFVVALAISI